MAFKKILLDGDAASPSDNVPASVGTAASAGTGAACSRDDHVHDIGVGAIDAANLFAAGVVDNTALGADCVDGTKIADNAIGNEHLGDNCVKGAEIDETATNITLAQVILTPAASGTGTAEGTIYYDSDDDHLYVYQAA